MHFKGRMVGKYDEERKFVGGRVAAIEEVSTTESIIVGNTVEGSIEDAIEVVSIEEEAREL